LAPQPEENTFFGWPLLVLLLVIVGWLRRRATVRALALVAVVFAVLSLGATANYHSRPVLTGAPWSRLNHLPLFDSVVPIRLGLVLVPVIAVLLALLIEESLSIDEVGRVRHQAGRVGWLIAVAVALLPLV